MTQPPLTARLRDFIDTYRGLDDLGYTGLMFQAAEALDLQAAQIAALTARLTRAVKAAEEHFGEDAIRHKLSLFQNGRARNVFPAGMDGKWFAFQRADNDAHVGLALRCAELQEALAPFVLANSSDEFVQLVVRSSDITKARDALAKAAV